MRKPLRPKRNKWQRVVGRAAAVGGAAANPTVKTAASTLAGITALTAASAALSSARRKSQS